jgi:hypothetical protein
MGRGFNSRRLHHLEHREKSSGALRAAMFVLANKSKGFAFFEPGNVN